jgi:hypothetical protein
VTGNADWEAAPVHVEHAAGDNTATMAGLTALPMAWRCVQLLANCDQGFHVRCTGGGSLSLNHPAMGLSRGQPSVLVARAVPMDVRSHRRAAGAAADHDDVLSITMPCTTGLFGQLGLQCPSYTYRACASRSV